MGIFDKQGNPIGDGRHHVKEHVYEFNEYPQISAKVTKSLTTETTYVKYYNSENGKSITVRFSNHVSNAVLFGDQLNGYTAKRDEILFYLGLKKRTLIPNTRLHIWTQSVAKKKLNDYEYTDKTIGDLYELGEGADISKHKGKIAKGSNYLILGDSVEKVIDKKINSLGQKVVLGEYVYSDISVSDEKFKRGGEITPDVCVNYIKKTESILRNGYYSDHGLFYLITYNSGGKEGLDVKQTINMNLTRSLSELMDVPEYFIMGTILTHYQEARRFDTIDVLKELEGKKIIIADRDLVVCSNIDPEIFSSIKEWANGGEEKKLDMKKPSCHDFIKGSESILTNGYYSDMGLFYLITYNSEMGKFTNVFQTVDYLIVDKLAFFLGFSDISIGAMLLKHYEEARRFDSLNILKEIKDKPVIIVDRDTIVCSNYDRKKVKLKDGGEVSSSNKIFGASSRQKPKETIHFDPPLVGTNGNKLISYTWSYEWTMLPNYEGELVSKRISNWDNAIQNAETGRDIVHQYTVELKDGELKTVSSETVPVILGLIEKEQKKVFGNLATASKTLAKQQLQLQILEAEEKQRNEALESIKNNGFPEITVEDSDWGADRVRLRMGDASCISNKSNPFEEERIRCVKDAYISEELKKLGFSPYSVKSTQIYDLKKRVERQKKKVETMLSQKMEEGSEINKETKMDSKIFIPSNLIEEIKKSINLGYDNLQEGMISKNRKGVMLVNDNYEVRGTYDVLLKSAINKMILEHKSDQLSKGTKVELEHKDTIEEISSGKLSPEEGAKEIAKDHIAEDPAYYDKLEKVESKTPIKELGTGVKVYFETPFYRVNEYSGSNLNDRFIFTMKAKDDQYGVPLFEHFFDDIDIALFVAEKISKIYPNGVPEAALIHRIIKDISGEYKEKQENNMNSTNNELTGVKSIIVNESIPFSNWNEANESTKWLISQQVWSNLPYKIEFQDGFILEGTIDAEPYSFWKDKKNPLTWHLNTFWGNLARATANPIYDQESIDYAKKVVTKYNIGQDISTDVDNSDVTPPESEDAEVVSSAKQDVIKKLLKEKKTAYNFVYDRLLKVAPDLLRLLNEAEYTSDVYGKSQYRTQDFGGNDAFMYLAIEGLDKDEQGRYELSISHYYKQHGDMMCDPCMTVRLDPELKTVEALTFKMDGVIGRGIIKSVYGTTKDGKPGINLYEKKDQNSFLNKWSSNWVKQGHKVEFRPLPEKEVSGTPISAEAQAVIQPEWDKMQDFLAGKEAKASDRKNENEIKREKYPIVVEWSEGSTDENIGFENLEQLEIWLEQIGFTETPDETYIKNKVWFRGITSYVRIDLSRKDGDFNPQEKSLIEYLIENVSKSFDWQSLSEAKTTIVQDANFTYFKGIQANYENQFKLNKAIEEFLDSRPDDYVYSNEEKEFIITYEGYGGLEKQGATGIGLLFEYYTPLKLIEKMWGLAYKYGFNTGKVLEPSVGVGRFLNYTGKTDVVKGYEINPYSAKICRIIHPKANIILSSFAEHFYKGNVFNPKFEKDFDLVIGNPPYGKMTDLRTHGENSRIGVSISQYEHYFILRGLDCLKSGGLLIYVSTANLATKGYEKIKEKIFEKADLVDCYLLPNTTFKQTKVNTSLIVLRRK